MRSTREMQTRGRLPVPPIKLHIPATKPRFAPNSCHLSTVMLPPCKNMWFCSKFTRLWQSRKGAGKEQKRSRTPQHAPWENRFSSIPQHGNVLWLGLVNHKVSGFLSRGGGLPAVLSPLTRGSQFPPDQHSTQVLGNIPPDNQRYPQPAQPLSNIYGNMFVLHWRFLGSDLDRPLFLSNMFCQIPSEISFIHSSSITQQAPHLAGNGH